jgi:predicted dehydrogenase
MAQKLNVAVIGAGAISGAYLSMARNFPVIQVAAISDIDMERARAKGAEFGVGRVLTVEEILGDDSIDIILNLTVPKAHAEISLRALEAGKHVFSEKPLGISVDEGRRIMELADAKSLRVGCAPDTFMGSGIQTARRLIGRGDIGRPVGFTAFMMNRGHESWHPNPDFYYQPGGGPMFDMGPYYITALLQLFGPIKRIMGMASIAIPQRTITSSPKAGQKITVQTPDHIVGSIEFTSGVVGSIVTTFAAWHPQYDERQPIIVYGENGTMKVPDPNTFDGPVSMRLAEEKEWKQMPPLSPTGFGRAVGLADMAQGIISGRPHRASGEQALYALEAMQAFLDSSARGEARRLERPYARPEIMPERLPYIFD